MKKRESRPANMMQHLAEVKHTKSTQSTQKAYKLPAGGELKPYRVRFPENHWKILKKHFDAQGMRISEGLRMIAREYMEREQLR